MMNLKSSKNQEMLQNLVSLCNAFLIVISNMLIAISKKESNVYTVDINNINAKTTLFALHWC